MRLKSIIAASAVALMAAGCTGKAAPAPQAGSPPAVVSSSPATSSCDELVQKAAAEDRKLNQMPIETNDEIAAYNEQVKRANAALKRAKGAGCDLTNAYG